MTWLTGRARGLLALLGLTAAVVLLLRPEPGPRLPLKPSQTSEFWSQLRQASQRPSPFPSCLPNRSRSEQDRLASITVVSAFLDIGSFRKVHGERRVRAQYEAWLRTLGAKLCNRLIFFTNSDRFARRLASLRQGTHFPNRTRIVKLQPSVLFSFQQLDKIKKALARKDHPRHPPAMTVAEYAAVMSAKYDLVQRVLEEEAPRYAMWLDLGWFRHYPFSSPSFVLVLPPAFNASCVAMNEVLEVGYEPRGEVTVEEIFRRGSVLLGGGLFLGTTAVLAAHVRDFRRAFTAILARGWAGSEQQVLYAMWGDEKLRKELQPTSQAQRYFQLLPQPHNSDRWFYLGYLMQRPCHSASNFS